MLIYLTATQLRQQRLQAGTVGGLKFRPESHARMRRERRAKPGPWAHLCNNALQQLSRVSIYATCSHAVTVYGCLTSCLLLSLHSISSQPAPTGSSCRWTGVGSAVSWSSPRSTSTLLSNLPYMGVTCCIAHAQCWSAGPATDVICSRFLRESSRFHSWEFGNGK